MAPIGSVQAATTSTLPGGPNAIDVMPRDQLELEVLPRKKLGSKLERMLQKKAEDSSQPRIGLAAVVATSIGPAGRHVTSATGQSSLKPRKEQVSVAVSMNEAEWSIVLTIRTRMNSISTAAGRKTCERTATLPKIGLSKNLSNVMKKLTRRRKMKRRKATTMIWANTTCGAKLVTATSPRKSRNRKSR